MCVVRVKVFKRWWGSEKKIPTIGTLVTFDQKDVGWVHPNICTANGINQAEKLRATLISAMEAATCSPMQNLLSPAQNLSRTGTSD